MNIKPLLEVYKKQLIVVGGILSVTSLIYLGFSTADQVTTHCSSKSTVYIDAKFSETTMSMDFEGNPYMDTDYWSERVSDIYSVTMRNLEVTNYNGEYFVTDTKVAIPNPNIPYDKSARNTRDFDRFDTVKSTKNKQHFGNGGYISISNNEYLGCYISINESTEVKYWYGISYGVVK